MFIIIPILHTQARCLWLVAFQTGQACMHGVRLHICLQIIMYS